MGCQGRAVAACTCNQPDLQRHFSHCRFHSGVIDDATVIVTETFRQFEEVDYTSSEWKQKLTDATNVLNGTSTTTGSFNITAP